MANTEQIEAKLCAYVDGELDAAARAEIEQHLAANPQHRQLLAELMEQRTLLRELPREKAPEDLFDSFQTQLERSVLLDANRPAAAGRRNRTSQMVLLAAILVLAIGLGAVIVFVLPDKSKHHDYAVIPPTTAPATGDFALAPAPAPTGSVLPAPTTAPGGALAEAPRDSIAKSLGVAPLDESKSDKFATGPATQTTLAAATPPPVEIAGKAGPADRKLDINGPGAPALNTSVTLAAPTAPIEAEIADRVKQSSQVPENSMVVVVATANPIATDQQVTGYLAMNNIRWEDVAQPTPAAGVTNASVTEAGVIDKKKGEMQKSPAIQATNRVQGSRPTTQPAEAYALKDAGDALQSSALAVAPPAPPSSQQQKEADKVPAAQQIAQSQQSQQLQAQQSQLASSPSRYIVARGLTQSQVGELYSCIAAQNTGSIANYRRSNGAITPTTLPVTLAMQQQAPSTQLATRSGQQFTFDGEMINGSVGGGVGGGGERNRVREMNQAQKQLSTPTTTVATGATSAKIADSPLPTTANSFDQAAVPTAAPTSPPTTQVAPTVTDVAAAAIAARPISPAATTAPTSQAVTSALVPQLLAGGATTAPSTQAGEERVDVVIVVKSTVPDAAPTATPGPVASEPPAAPASAPASVATQPAPAPILKARRP